MPNRRYCLTCPNWLALAEGQFELPAAQPLEDGAPTPEEGVPPKPVKNGIGVYKLDGNEYEGEWVSDKMQGHGMAISFWQSNACIHILLAENHGFYAEFWREMDTRKCGLRKRCKTMMIYFSNDAAQWPAIALLRKPFPANAH